jgi:NADPH-dependent 2,4-dienoyl-CoA reductase/sulfur reductase-like enzyme/rhodanese-related sulfurtransferase
MKRKKVIIIGAALAGPTAASRAREMDENAEITLLERNTRVSYSLAGLSFHLSKEVNSLDDLNQERESFFENVYNIKVLTKTEVVGIDRKNKKLSIIHNSDKKILEYDSLIFATGAASIHPEGLPFVSNFRYFRTLDDLAAIKASIDRDKKRFIVLGGGSMGLEAVDGLVRGGAEVCLLEKNPQILPNFGDEISMIAESKLKEKVNLILGFQNLEFETEENQLVAVVVDGKRIETDFLVSAIGVKPRTELLQASGIKINKDGTVPIDKYCRTSDKNIFACSICVATPSPWGQAWIPQAAVADKTAQVAGANSVGQKFKLGLFQASMIVRLPTGEVGRVGHSEKEIINMIGKKNLGMSFLKTLNIEPYMPNSKPFYGVLYFNKKNNKILGMEAYGSDIKSRLDAIAVAILKGSKLEELSQLDFSYSPAFGTARDGLNSLATIAMFKQEGLTSWIHPRKIHVNPESYFIVNVGLDIEDDYPNHLHIPLEKLRAEWKILVSEWQKSQKLHCILISHSGRRGHLAVRILKSLGVSSKNVMGGYELFSLFGSQK